MLNTFDSSLGHMALATVDGEVAGLSFGHATADRALRSLRAFHGHSGQTLLGLAAEDDSSATTRLAVRVARMLQRFAEGEPVDFSDIAVSYDGLTTFQQVVIAACRAIPWGQTISYGELAAEVGHPGAARAVGTVMRKNRVPLIVPCHRVLAAGGRLGGYSAPSGLRMKQRLLALEKSEQVAAMFS